MNERIFAVFETRRFLFWKRTRIISVAGTLQGAIDLAGTQPPGGTYTVGVKSPWVLGKETKAEKAAYTRSLLGG